MKKWISGIWCTPNGGDTANVKWVFDENGKLTSMNILNVTAMKSVAYLRFCCTGLDETSIVSVNAPIIEGGSTVVTYSISQNLTNVSSSNSQTSITNGGSFSTTLTANSGYELDSVVVTMGGTDITSTAYSNGVVTISNVTGNVIITATANIIVSTAYTNQLPISTDLDENVYNGTGYKENTYLSYGLDGTRSGIYASGFIPCKMGDTLYFKNCTITTGQSNHRFCFYGSDKVMLENHQFNTSNPTGNITVTYGDDGNLSSLYIAKGDYMADTAYIRFCCGGLDATSIVAVNEPIE